MIITVCVIPWIPGMQWMMRPQLPLIVSFCSARAAGPAILCINNMLGVSDSCTTHHCFLSKGQTGNLLAGVDWGQIKAVCSSCPHLLRQGNMYFPHLLILTFGVLFHLEKMQNCNSDNITCSGSYLPSHSKTTPSHFKQHSNIVNLCFALFQLIKYKDFFLVLDHWTCRFFLLESYPNRNTDAYWKNSHMCTSRSGETVSGLFWGVVSTKPWSNVFWKQTQATCIKICRNEDESRPFTER